jgi:hypothetical protein
VAEGSVVARDEARRIRCRLAELLDWPLPTHADEFWVR